MFNNSEYTFIYTEYTFNILKINIVNRLYNLISMHIVIGIKKLLKMLSTSENIWQILFLQEIFPIAPLHYFQVAW